MVVQLWGCRRTFVANSYRLWLLKLQPWGWGRNVRWEERQNKTLSSEIPSLIDLYIHVPSKEYVITSKGKEKEKLFETHSKGVISCSTCLF